jgi:hypothetical protein
MAGHLRKRADDRGSTGSRSASTTKPASYETKAVAMEPAITVGLDGSPESLAAAYRAEVRETDTAVLFFVGDRAYRLKKPVDPEFLGHTTVACRRRGASPGWYTDRPTAGRAVDRASESLICTSIRLDTVTSEQLSPIHNSYHFSHCSRMISTISVATWK